MHATVLGVLKEVFGYDGFRPHQESIIGSVMAGEDVLAVMPTGGGKSLCYQVPALVLGPGSLVIVVSPLIALMREQVAFLRGLGVEARLLNSTLDAEEWRRNAEAAASGQVRLLYLAPETLASQRTAELLSRAKVDLLAVDEAHCISEWGHDFRPEYRSLGEIRSRLVSRDSGRARVPCLALTATATERVREDIARELGLAGRTIVASFDRPNIFLEVRRRARAVDQLVELAGDFVEGSGIVYCFSRARAEALAADLTARGVRALPYHAGLPDEERSANQDAFIRDEVRVICATTAFGMGIDKPDVRFVAHADLPKSLEQYYQEVGRAGRDGLPARALLLFGYGDAVKIRSLVAGRDGDSVSPEQAAAAEASLRGMLRFAETADCRRVALLSHFGEDYRGPAGAAAEMADLGPAGEAQGCGACDICAGSTDAATEEDATTEAYKFLSCVKRSGERYGAGHVADVLIGSRNERVLALGHSELSTWGIGKEWAKAQWLDLAAQLTRKGYLAKDEDYGVLSLTEKAYAAFRDKSPISAVLPPRPKGKSRDGAAPRAAKAGNYAPGSPESVLEAALRGLRKSLADQAKLPNYMIFSDRTLFELVERVPRSGAALLEVFGLGEVKVARFGSKILDTLAKAIENGDSAL